MLQLGNRGVRDAGKNVGKPCLRIDVVELCRHDQGGHEGGTVSTRSDPAKSHDFLPSAKPLSARSAALFVRQILPSSKNDVKPSQRLSM